MDALFVTFAIVGAIVSLGGLGFGLYFAFCWLIYKIGWAK